ncbi:MAG: hypothetical protein JNL01_07100 [Bdellovibrionales bacterium]|nr:hypothetical protein [Bdellovibrionales bacterium]
MKNTGWVLVFVAALGFSESAHALSSYSATALGALSNQDQVDTLVGTMALGTNHRAYEPATSLGAVIGLDIGFDLALIRVSSDFQNLMTAVGAAGVPNTLPLPRINLHKGLPGRVDLGFSWVGYQGNSVYGIEAKFTPLEGPAVPAIAIRGAYTFSKIYFMDTGTFTFDALISKKLAIIDPYLGFGYIYYSGNLIVPTGQSLAPTISAASSGGTGRFFIGLPLKLGFLKLTPEWESTFSKISNIGLKASLAL